LARATKASNSAGQESDPPYRVPDLEAGRYFGRIEFFSRRTVIVAVSGGSDSLALLFLLKRYLDASGSKVPLLAVTVDHRLRPESTGEARKVGGIASGAGIEHRIVPWEGPKPATGVSARAREARHRLLAEVAREAGTDIVLTGHTMDDQAETVAMRRQRGRGRGEAGIAAATLFDGRCWFVRPLLETRREALRQFLTGIGQEWIEDPSNVDLRFERARLRAELAGSEGEALAAQAREAGARREMLGRRAAALIADHAGTATPGLVRLDPEFAAVEDREAAVYALRILLAAVGGREQLPDTEKTAELFDGLRRSPFRATLSRTVVEARKAGIFLHRERRGLPQPQPFAPGIWDGRFRLDGHGTDVWVAPADSAGKMEEPDGIPASLVRSAHAARPALWRDGRFVRLLDEADRSAWTAQPIVAPWARYLPSFDIEPARTVAKLIGAAEIPPLPLAGHNLPEA
jgi:tRNA(Ile)-lysidine synthase